MKTSINRLFQTITISVAIALSSAHAADVTFTTNATYTDTQVYDNGTFGGGDGRVITFNSGANYTFNGNLTMPLAWHHVILNSGASLTVAGTISTDVSGISLNGGVLTTGGLQLHDGPFWAGTINDGKQDIEPGDSIINGSTIIASQSNAGFITIGGGTGGANGWVGNNLWLGNDGATMDSNGFNIGVTMALGNFGSQSGNLTKTGAGTLTLSANNSYGGGTTVNQGVLEITGSSAGNSYIRGTVTVNSGAELRYTGGDGTGFGFNGGNRLDAININGGLVQSQNVMTHLWGATVNLTGGELRVNNGVSSPTGQRIEWNQSTVNTLASASTSTISGRVNFRNDGGYTSAVFNVGDGTAATDLLVSAAITESATVGLTKNGSGTMELSGNNSYTGATVINEGVLKIGVACLSDSSNVVIGSGAKIDLSHASNDVVGGLVIEGVTMPSGSYNTSHPTYGSYFLGAGTLQVGAPGPQQSGTWISSSNGNWSDSANWSAGSVANGTDNTATFNPGAPVTIAVDGNRFIGALSFTGADSTLTGADTLNLDNTSFTPSTISVASGITATLATNLGGTLGVEKSGSGTLVFTGSKSYTGGTTVTAGTLELSGAMGGNAQIHGSVLVNPGATLKFTNGDGTGFGFFNNPVTSITVDGGTILAASGSHLGFGPFMSMTLDNGAVLQGNWQWNGDALLAFSSFGDSTNTISASLNLRNDNGSSHTFTVNEGASAIDLLISGTLAGNSSHVVKEGAGNLTLSGSNTYTGNTLVNFGTLAVSSSGSLKFRPTTNGITNSVTGSAAAGLSFLGTVDLDLGAVTASIGNNWNLFNVASFSGTPPTLTPIAVTSTAGSFTEVSPGVWELPVPGAKWVFTESNGNLAHTAAAGDFDTWAASFGLSGGNAGDDDQDGLTNEEEYAFGLIPNSGSSVNPIAIPLDRTSGTFSYNRRTQSLTGLSYTVWYSTDLTSWTQDGGASQSVSATSGEVETVQVTLSGPLLTNPKLFVQVRAQ